MFSTGGPWVERVSHRFRHGINRMSSCATIFVVNTIALIMAFDESGPHKFGHRAADGGHAAISDPFADLRFHEPFGLCGI